MLASLSPEEIAELTSEIDHVEVQYAVGAPQTDDELHAWILENCGVDIPRVAVCEGHCAPFDFVADAFYGRTQAAVVLAGREGLKTLGVACLWCAMAKFIPGVEMLTAGAIEAQSKRLYAHVKNLLRTDPRDIDLKDHPDLLEAPMQSHTRWKNGSELEIVGGSIKALNGPHPNKFHFDEVDLADPPQAFEESRNISSTKGHITKQDFITSTRKSKHGPMQKLLDEIAEAKRLGTIPPFDLFSWCFVETNANVPTCQIANPDLPDGERCNCDRVVKGTWDDGSPRRFSDVCKGRLAKSQGFTPLSDIQGVFMQSSRGTFEAQRECIKPDVEGLVFHMFTPGSHGIRQYVPDMANGPLFQHVDWGGAECYDSETEVLTRQGWVPFPEVTEEDEFASLDLETEKVEFQKPRSIISKRYVGEMHRYKNRSIDLLVTKNHNMLVAPLNRKGKWGLKHSCDVKKCSIVNKTSEGLVDCEGGDFVLPGMKDGNGRYLSELQIPANVWAAFLGLWMAEGHASERKGFDLEKKGTRGTQEVDYHRGTVVISHQDIENTKQMKSMLSPYFKVCIDKGGRGFRISDPRLFDHMRTLSVGAANKRIPSYVKNWNRTLLRIYLEWHMRGDGCVDTSTKTGRTHSSRIYTSSKVMAGDLQEISMYAGLSANITKRSARGGEIDGRRVIGRHPSYCVSIIHTRNKPRLHNKSYEAEARTVLPQWEGMVYCAELPKHHTLYVRRNGKAVWCGNSQQAVGWYQLLAYEIEVSSYAGKSRRLKQGTLVLFDELYELGIGNLKLADMVIEREREWRKLVPGFKVSYRFPDPQGWAARQDFKDKGLPTYWSATRDIKAQIKLCKDSLEDNLFAVDVLRCPNFLAEIEYYHYPKKKAGEIDDPEIPVDDFNHMVAGWRYTEANLHRLRKQKKTGQGHKPTAGGEGYAPVGGTKNVPVAAPGKRYAVNVRRGMSP